MTAARRAPRRRPEHDPVSLETPETLNALERGPALVRAAACEVLGRRGAPPVVVDALVAALSDPEAAVQGAAAQALGMVGPTARDAATTPLLRLVRRSPDDAARAASAVALYRVGARGASSARVLARALTDERREVRLHAALLLRTMEPPDLASALPALVTLLGHRSDDVCDEVVRTIVHLGNERPEAVVRAVQAAVRPSRPRAAATAARILTHLDRLDAARADDVFDWLVHRDEWVRTCAAVVVGGLALDAPQRARRTLEALSAAKPEALRHLLTLWPALRLGPAAAAAVRDLARDRRPAVRRVAVACAARLTAGAAAPLLMAIARGDRAEAVRADALEALGREDLTAAGVLDLLLAALRRAATCAPAARALCRRLARSPDEARRATGRVLEALSSPSVQVREAAALCLTALRAWRRET